MRHASRGGSHLIAPDGDLVATLENCEGHYVCPQDPDGTLLGPVVGYTAEYEPGKNWVGLAYYNFAKADPWPAVRRFFAAEIVRRLTEMGIVPDIILDAPWAGVKISQAVGGLIGCRDVFGQKDDGDVILGRYDDVIQRGDTVVIGEELVNNTSTTGKLVALVEKAGGRVIGISCAINRSYPFAREFCVAPDRLIPIVGAIERSTPQYRQDDPVVAGAIAAGNVVWHPKYEWPRLKAAMDAHR